MTAFAESSDRPAWNAALPEVVKFWATHAPAKICLVEADGGRSITFSDLDERSSRWACALEGAGVGAEDRVGSMLTNCIEGTLFWLAAAKRFYPIQPLGRRLVVDDRVAVGSVLALEDLYRTQGPGLLHYFARRADGQDVDDLMQRALRARRRGKRPRQDD